MKQTVKRLFRASAIIFFLASVSAAEPQLPEPQGMVSDFAGKLSGQTKESLETLLRNFRDRGGIEVAVVTIPYEQMQDYPIEDYALYLGRKWGVGRDSQKRGLLLVVAIKPPDAQGRYSGSTRLEVSRHLEGEIPDGLAGELIRRMRGDFQVGRFDQALTTGTQTILATLAQKLGISMEGIDQTQAYRQPVRRPTSGSRGISPFTIIILIFIFLAIVRGIGGGRGGGGGGGRGRRRGFDAGWMLWPIIFGGGRGGFGGGGFGGRGSDSGWGGGGFGGGGGGGFGGFGGGGGGGDFGGGGASDSW